MGVWQGTSVLTPSQQSARPCRCLLLRCAAPLTARLVTAALRLHVAAPVIAAHGLVVVRPFRTVRVSHVFAPAPADFAYHITWIVTGLCAPSLSQLPLRGPRNLHDSGSTGQDRTGCTCVCVYVCVRATSVGWYTYAWLCCVCCQQARLLEGVLLYLPLWWLQGSYTFYLKYTYLLTMHCFCLDLNKI